MAEKNTLLTWLVVLVCIFGLANTLFTIGMSNKISAGVSESELKAAISRIVFQETVSPEQVVDLSGIETRLGSLELEVRELGDEDVSEEAEAERLVLEELDTRDFKKSVFDALVGFNESIESYRHITDIVIKDLDVVYENEEANVTVDIKVYYYIDGDEDENERAMFEEFVVLVTDLDEDENFVDAEVVGYEDLVVAKVY